MINTIFNYIRVIHLFWITSIASELEYRLNFFVEIVCVVGNLIGSIFTLSIFYNQFDSLGGWTWMESLVVLGIYTFLEGFTISFLQPNLSRIVQHIQNGTLDFVLLKPVGSQFWLSFRRASPWGLPSMLSGIAIVSFSLIKQSIEISPTYFLLFSLMFISSLTILYGLWFLIATTSIWFVKVWNANEVLKSTLVAGRYPIYAYPIPVRTILTFVIPVSFLTTIPAEAILGSINLIDSILSCSIALFILFLSCRFWLYALKFYTSASS